MSSKCKLPDNIYPLSVDDHMLARQNKKLTQEIEKETDPYKLTALEEKRLIVCNKLLTSLETQLERTESEARVAAIQEMMESGIWQT